jgi:trk system potassium uptake protein TrkH
LTGGDERDINIEYKYRRAAAMPDVFREPIAFLEHRLSQWYPGLLMDNAINGQKFAPQKLLVLGFIVIILAGTGMLLLPAATSNGITFTDAFFTATSSVCVTGLIVKSTPADFTLFGKIIILILIQIGGLGYMSMATFLALLAGRKIGLTHRILIKESLNIATHEGIVRLIKGMLFFVVLAESAGAVVLYLKFRYGYHLGDPLLQSVFHSISAFNNAGFSLFEDSLAGFRSDILINVTVMSLIILGGIGFMVVDDLYDWLKERERRLMLHTRIVLITTVVLIAAGTVLVYITERNYLFMQSDFTRAELVLSSVFASVTARTAGFNTIDYSLLQHATLFLTIMLMFIGASPGSTGGGIKTTTFSVIILHLWCTVRGRVDTVAFKRRIPADLVSKSLVVLSLSIIYVTIVTLIIVDIEHTQFIKTLFEVVSAFATVGLSTGDGGVLSFCAGFSDLSKIIIIVTMFAGRLGPLTLFMALIEQREQRIRYPEGRVMIG